MSFKYTSHHHWWYATQESHGATYVVLTLSLLIRPVWPSTYDELVSLSKKKYLCVCAMAMSDPMHGCMKYQSKKSTHRVEPPLPKRHCRTRPGILGQRPPPDMAPTKRRKLVTLEDLWGMAHT